MIALDADAVSWMPRQPKSTIFSGWPSAQAASRGPPEWPVSVPDAAKPPLPTPSYLPFQAASGGSHTSNAMSESGDGSIEPCTRQKGAFTATGVGGSLPTTLDGGDTFVAAVIVASPKALPARLPQSAASAPPAPNESAHAATEPMAAKRQRRCVHCIIAFDISRSLLNRRPGANGAGTTKTAPLSPNDVGRQFVRVGCEQSLRRVPVRVNCPGAVERDAT